jgi:hypothetical protein
VALRTILFTGLRILAVCFLFAACFAIGGALSGLDKIGQQTVASQAAPAATQQVPQMPENFLCGFLIFTLCVGGTLSYVILRSRWLAGRSSVLFSWAGTASRPSLVSSTPSPSYRTNCLTE